MKIVLQWLPNGRQEAYAFKKAAELAPTNPAIKDSEILKKHTGM